MDHSSSDVTDPIEAKLRDSNMMDRVVRGAVADAVERARRLGFLDESSEPVDHRDFSRGAEGKT